MSATSRLAGAVVLALSLTAAAGSPTAAQEYRFQIEPGAVPVPRGDLYVADLAGIWTATGEVLENSSILIRDGRIAEIGGNPPDGVEVIDGTGLVAIPGIVDQHSHIAMQASNEGSSPTVPEIRVIDAIGSDDFGIFRALSGGVTTAQILHGSSNPIGGQSAIIKTRYRVGDSDRLLVQGAPQTVKFALGENVTRKNSSGGSGPRRFPGSRQGVEAVYIQAFEAAQAYRDLWNDYRADPGSYRVPPRHDLRLEALVDIMEGRIRVHAHSYRSDEIVMLIRIAERFGFKIDVFTHVLEGFKVADEMAAHGAGGSTFADWWMYKLEAFDAIPYNATLMHEHGVVSSLNSDIPWLQSFLLEEMSKPVKYGGLDPQEALRMLTLYPAQQLRLGDRVGSLEIGKDGDVVLLSGHPFNSYTRVEQTIVDGMVYYDRTREVELRGEPVRAMPDIAPQVAGDYGDGAPEALPQQPLPASLMDPNHQLVTDAVVALTGATVHPVSSAPIENGVVVVRDGRIEAIGAAGQVDIPSDARRVDVSGQHIYPGMINAISQLGMTEIGAVNASRDDREIGKYNPHIRALTGVHPHSVHHEIVRANGITANLSIQNSGVIQGMGSLIQLDGDTPERMDISSRAAMVVDLPSASGNAWDEPSLEGDDLEELLELFRRATTYANHPGVLGEADAPFEVNLAESSNILLDAMAPAMRGEVPVMFHARRERDIRTLLMVMDSFPEIRGVVVGGDQAFQVAEELAERDIPVVLTSVLRPTMDRDDPVTAGWRNPGILEAAGVRVAFGTNDAEFVRNLPFHAARSVAYGMPQEAALRAVTLGAAEILGVGDRLGSLEVGKRADLIITDGDPLQITTHVDRMFIMGREVSLESKHTELYRQFKDRRGAAPVTISAADAVDGPRTGGGR